MQNGGKTQKTEEKLEELFSVAVIIHECRDAWKACLDSVFAQTYARLELIICDNSSCDFKQQEVEDYIRKNKRENIERTVTLVSEAYVGTTRIRQMALEAAEGKWISILSGDSRLAATDILQRAAEYFLNHSDCRILSTIGQACDPEGKLLYQFHPEWNTAYRMGQRDSAGQFVYFSTCTKNLFAFIDAAFFERAALIEIGGFDECYPNEPAWPLWLKATGEGIRIHYETNMFSVYFRHVDWNSECFVPDAMEYEERGAVYYDRIKMLRKIALPKLQAQFSGWDVHLCRLAIREIEAIRMEQLEWGIISLTARIKWRVSHPQVMFSRWLMNAEHEKTFTNLKEETWNACLLMVLVYVVYHLMQKSLFVSQRVFMKWIGFFFTVVIILRMCLLCLRFAQCFVLEIYKWIRQRMNQRG